MLLREISRLRRTLPAPTSPRFQRPSSGDDRPLSHPSSQQIHRTRSTKTTLHGKKFCILQASSSGVCCSSIGHFRRNGNVAVPVHKRRALQFGLLHLCDSSFNLQSDFTFNILVYVSVHVTSTQRRGTCIGPRAVSHRCAHGGHKRGRGTSKPLLATAAASPPSRASVSIDAPAPHAIGGNDNSPLQA